MAEFKIDGRMTVRQLKENFKNEFEGTLRVYNGREKADDSATLASIRINDEAKGGELVCRASRTVGKFEQEMLDVFGIKVQVASPDDWVLALDGITLANLKNIKKNATKADMEELVAYKRMDKSTKTISEEEDILTDASVNGLSEDEIKRLEGLEYSFSTECSIEDELEDPKDEGYWEAVTIAWEIVSNIDNGEYVDCCRADLSLRKTQPDGAYLHFEGNQVDFMVVVADGEIISVITRETAERAKEIVWG